MFNFNYKIPHPRLKAELSAAKVGKSKIQRNHVFAQLSIGTLSGAEFLLQKIAQSQETFAQLFIGTLCGAGALLYKYAVN